MNSLQNNAQQFESKLNSLLSEYKKMKHLIEEMGLELSGLREENITLKQKVKEQSITQSNELESEVLLYKNKIDEYISKIDDVLNSSNFKYENIS